MSRSNRNGKFVHRQGNVRSRRWHKVYRDRIKRRLESCRKCGITTSSLELAHIIPWSNGGPNAFSNTTILCTICNNGFRNTHIVWFSSLSEEESMALPERQWSKVWVIEGSL